MEPSFLLIDASCSTNLVALVLPARKMRFTQTFTGREYPGENLLFACEAWYEHSGLEKGAVDYYATSHGPGSLTGLRVAGSFIRTLAQVYRKPVVTVNSLWALDRSISAEGREVVTIIQARQDRYYARYRSAEDPDDYALLSGEELLHHFPADALYCLEERCDLARRFPDQFSKRDYVLQKMDPDSYVDALVQSVRGRSFKPYSEVVLHYGGPSVAEETFFRRNGSML